MSVPALAHGLLEALGSCMWPRGPVCPAVTTQCRCPQVHAGPVREDPPLGPEDRLGSKRAGTGGGPAVPLSLPGSGFLCAKQPRVRLTSAALLEICPHLSPLPREFLTGVSGSSVAGSCRPTVQVPVQLGRRDGPSDSAVSGPGTQEDTQHSTCSLQGRGQGSCLKEVGPHAWV